jgi:glycosyltransferase involved in cell wall biosynthesis
MKIVFVSPFPPAQDGIGTYSQTMITALHDAGHEARVVLPHRQKHQSGEVIGALSSRRSGLRLLHDAVIKWDPDIIHVQFAFAAFGARTRALCSWLRLIHAATGIPVVVTMHEVTRDTSSLRRPIRVLYRSLATQCDHVIVHTRAALDMLTGPIGVPRAKCNVIPHPEPMPPRAVSAPSDLRARFSLGDMELLVAFGFVYVEKGLADLVRALSILRNSGACRLDDVRLVIAGTVRPRHGLFRFFELRDHLHLARVLGVARHAGLYDNIVLTGWVPEADVAGWFQAAAAVVLPYRRAEQSGVAALANAFGVPVLASTAGGLGEQYVDSGWTFPPGDQLKLAEVLARFLATSPNERALNRTDRHAADLNVVVKATLDLYQGHNQAKDSPQREESVNTGYSGS